MSNKTINQALTDLYLGLGGDSKELEDNTKVSDYIEDLEGAIKGATSSLIDDSEASEDTTYSSSKIEAILPDGLPEVTSSDEGKVLSVSSDGEWVPSEASGGDQIVIYEVRVDGNTRSLPEGVTCKTLLDEVVAGKLVYLKLIKNIYALESYNPNEGDGDYGLKFISFLISGTSLKVMYLSAYTPNSSNLTYSINTVTMS